MFWEILKIYLAVMNLAAFCMFGIDKSRARRGRWRIPERRLVAAALFGGSLGALAGMYVFHHKTRHKLFSAGIPLIAVLQAGAAVLYCIRWLNNAG